VPDVSVLGPVAHGEAWQGRTLFGVLDTGRFTLVVVHPEGSDSVGVDWCRAVEPWAVIRVVGIAPPREEEATRSVSTRPSGDRGACCW
jgi:hypothetical protein